MGLFTKIWKIYIYIKKKRLGVVSQKNKEENVKNIEFVVLVQILRKNVKNENFRDLFA